MRREPPARPVDAARSVLDQLLPLFTRTRTERGLSLRAAARELGCGIATLSDWQAGKSDPRLALVRAIVGWIAGDQPDPAAVAVRTDELTGTQQDVYELLVGRAGYGPAWLGIAAGGYRLILPYQSREPDGQIRYSDYGVHRRRTLRTLEQAGLVSISTAIERLPHRALPQNPLDARPSLGHRVTLTDRKRADHDQQPAAEHAVAVQPALPVPGDAPDPGAAGDDD